MDVIDAIREFVYKSHRIEELMYEMTRVVINTELRTMVDSIECFARGHKIIGDLRGMHLQAKFSTLLLEHIQHRIPARGEILVTLLNHTEVVRRKLVDHVPYAGSRE